MKTKIRSYSDQATDFHSREMPETTWRKKDKTIIHSVFTGMQIHWKRKKVIRYITNDLIFSSDDSDESNEE